MGKTTRWLKGFFGIKPSNSGDCRDPKQCSFGPSAEESAGGLCYNPQTIPPNISESEAAWLRSYCVDKTDKEQNMHAIAVAAATEAAVAAAKAAAAVVRLTCQGKSGPFTGCGRDRLAAVKIQSAFRGYLARKALRALKGVVKIQALMRGYLVRKQAAETLRSMQALVRAQATVKLQRALNRINNGRFENRARKSMERFDYKRSNLTFSTHNRRLSASFDNRFNHNEETAKIVEVDTGTQSGSRYRRPTTSVESDLSDDTFRRTFSSPLSGRIPPRRISIPKPEWDEYSRKFPTAQSTPRFASGSPSKSSCCGGGGEDYHRGCFYGDLYPNYMADTTSFRAKLRSQSAPRQRPGTPAAAAEKMIVAGWRKSVSGGVRGQRSTCSAVREAVGFRDAVVGKIDRSSVSNGETERYYWQQRRW